MALKVGILGLGFMGKMHYDTYGRMEGAEVAAISDVDAKKRSGDWSGIAGNIGGAGEKTDLSGVSAYSQADDMFADPKIDVVDITLPTYLHAANATRALEAGKHVICEKPIAIDSQRAAEMIEAAEKAKRRLFVAHCIRFWPQYAVAREVVKSGEHGRVISAVFRRFSATPTWSWENWLQEPTKSGLTALDLHIHDADFILYCFGTPKSVTSHAAGLGLKEGRIDHIVTSYEYGPGQLVVAEGGWEYAPGFPFSMSFTIAMEKATLNCTADLTLTLHPAEGESKALPCPAGDGYEHELRHFVECIAEDKPSEVVSPQSAMESVKLIECEMESVRTGETVPVEL